MSVRTRPGRDAGVWGAGSSDRASRSQVARSSRRPASAGAGKGQHVVFTPSQDAAEQGGEQGQGQKGSGGQAKARHLKYLNPEGDVVTFSANPKGTGIGAESSCFTAPAE